MVIAKIRERVFRPDERPAKRIRDRDVFTLFHSRAHRCVMCGNRQVTAAHILGRGAGGDDVDANLVPLCGGGSGGCHGAYDNGHSYDHPEYGRITPEKVRWAVAVYVRGDDRASAYLIGKLGPFGAEAFVQKLERGADGFPEPTMSRERFQ